MHKNAKQKNKRKEYDSISYKRYKEKMKVENKRNYLKEEGITLIALVVTIVVLLILAGVTINALFGDTGIINRAKDAQNKMNQAAENDLKAINGFDEWIDEQTNGTTGGKKPLITDSSLTSDDRTTSESTTVIAEDKNGNQVVVPGGFKISGDSGESVEQGIVIEDKDGNQFVWVPVSNINGDGSNKIKKDDGSEVEITLGRYEFDGGYNSSTEKVEGTGEPTLIQKGSEYAEVTVANVEDRTVDTKYKAGDHCYELSDSITSNEREGATGTNTTAKNLKEFIEKTEANKGFYIARYEASYGSGYNAEGTDTPTKFGNAKPLSKPSTANSTSSMNYTSGTLWNRITQPQAALISQNMYKNDSYVESDLINSYAWDTAILYIQAMGNANYANQTDGNGTLKNTGSTGDEKCKIFDMAGNLSEWTTEYCFLTIGSSAAPCINRGGYYGDSNGYTSKCGYGRATSSSDALSFRTLLYVK